MANLNDEHLSLGDAYILKAIDIYEEKVKMIAQEPHIFFKLIGMEDIHNDLLKSQSHPLSCHTVTWKDLLPYEHDILYYLKTYRYGLFMPQNIIIFKTEETITLPEVSRGSWRQFYTHPLKRQIFHVILDLDLEFFVNAVDFRDDLEISITKASPDVLKAAYEDSKTWVESPYYDPNDREWKNYHPIIRRLMHWNLPSNCSNQLGEEN